MLKYSTAKIISLKYCSQWPENKADRLNSTTPNTPQTLHWRIGSTFLAGMVQSLEHILLPSTFLLEWFTVCAD